MLYQIIETGIQTTISNALCISKGLPFYKVNNVYGNSVLHGILYCGNKMFVYATHGKYEFQLKSIYELKFYEN